jgi:uncharacterized membrane protein
MSTDDLRLHARGGLHPIHAILSPAAMTCFVGALITDITYWRTAAMQWANFSAWLLAVGVLVAVVAAVAGLVDVAIEPRARASGSAWAHGLGSVAVVVIAALDNFVHSRDAYTSVVPAGLLLSLLLVVFLVFIGWNGWRLAYDEATAEREDRR